MVEEPHNSDCRLCWTGGRGDEGDPRKFQLFINGLWQDAWGEGTKGALTRLREEDRRRLVHEVVAPLLALDRNHPHHPHTVEIVESVLEDIVLLYASFEYASLPETPDIIVCRGCGAEFSNSLENRFWILKEIGHDYVKARGLIQRCEGKNASQQAS